MNLKEKLKQAGSRGLDLSPGDPLATEALERIEELVVQVMSLQSEVAHKAELEADVNAACRATDKLVPNGPFAVSAEIAVAMAMVERENEKERAEAAEARIKDFETERDWLKGKNKELAFFLEKVEAQLAVLVEALEEIRDFSGLDGWAPGMRKIAADTLNNLPARATELVDKAKLFDENNEQRIELINKVFDLRADRDRLVKKLDGLRDHVNLSHHKNCTSDDPCPLDALSPAPLPEQETTLCTETPARGFEKMPYDYCTRHPLGAQFWPHLADGNQYCRMPGEDGG